MLANDIKLIPYDHRKLKIVREIAPEKCPHNENNNENLAAATTESNAVKAAVISVTNQPQGDTK